MEFFETMRDKLQNKLSTALNKAKALREDINDEIRLHKLRKQLVAIEKDQHEVYILMGKRIRQLIEDRKSLSEDDFFKDLSYLKDLDKKILDLQNNINQFYETPELAKHSKDESLANKKSKGDMPDA